MSVDFIDSNVVIYSVDLSQPAKRAVARRLIEHALQTGDGHISF